MNTMRDMQARQKYVELEAVLHTLSPEVAIARISQFIQEFSDYPQAHNDLAVLLHQRGELLQALGRFERAVRLAPRNCTFRKNLASFYFVELGWTDDAIFLYTDLLKEDQNDTEVLGALAMISNTIGRPDEAGHFLRKILDLEPWNSYARSMLALLAAPVTTAASVIPPTPVYTAQEDVDTLLADLRQSIAGLSQSKDQSAPGETPGTDVVTDARIVERENLLSDDPTNALLNNDLGVLYLEKGDLDRSCAYHELAFRSDPGNLNFRKNLAGVCAISEGKMDRAIELLTGGLREHPADTEILAALVQVCIRLGRKEEALTFLKRILDLEPWNQDARSLLTQFQQSPGSSFFLNS